jgi:hypothetical protein
MSVKSESANKLCCKVCNKLYKSMSSLCNHNKKFHNNKTCNITHKSTELYENNDILPQNKLNCLYCKKNLSRTDALARHTKICKKKNDIKENKELEIKKIELEKINAEKEKINAEKEKIKEQNEMIRLKIKLQNCKKLDNKTFKAINKFLMDRSFKNSNNNNINSQNNNTINNYQILSIGDEQLKQVLTFKEKKQIMNARLCSLEKIVEIAHCGTYTKFKNIVITNLKDNFAYKYDENKGFFVTVTKNDALGDLISYRIIDIEAIYNELSSANKIDDKTKELIQKFLDKIESDDVPYYDVNEDVKYSNYKSYKINDIKILLYNNQDKITKDIALLFSNDSHDTIEI